MVEEFRISAMSQLLSAMEEEIRRIARDIADMGVANSLIAQYDALCRLSETCFDELESESTAEFTVVSELASRLGDFNLTLEELAEENTELDEIHSRSSEIRANSNVFRSDILGSCGFSRNREKRSRLLLRSGAPPQVEERLEWEIEDDDYSNFDEVAAIADLVPKKAPTELETAGAKVEEILIRPSGRFQTLKRRMV